MSQLLIFNYSPLDFLIIGIIAFVILLILIPFMIKRLEQQKICMMNNKGRCDSAYAKGKKCNGIMPSEECPYNLCKAEMWYKQK